MPLRGGKMPGAAEQDKTKEQHRHIEGNNSRGAIALGRGEPIAVFLEGKACGWLSSSIGR